MMKSTITCLIGEQEIISKEFRKLETYLLIIAGVANFFLIVYLLFQ